MSAIVKLQAKMPADVDMNGLDSTITTLLKEPEKLQAAVIFYNVSKITVTPETGTEVPTIVPRRFEPIGNASEIGDAVLKVMLDAARTRTGKEPLPLDVVEVVNQAELDD